ncbi:MAG: hypothetical protein IPF47_26020 [Gemmatimonadetes bacterium]|nr:hypothetical protein [Gemmatimonadota bacterium]
MSPSAASPGALARSDDRRDPGARSGAMVQLRLIGLAQAYRHPALGQVPNAPLIRNPASPNP